MIPRFFHDAPIRELIKAVSGDDEVFVYPMNMARISISRRTEIYTVPLSIGARFCDYGAPVFVINVDPRYGWHVFNLSWGSIYCNWRDQTQ